MTIDLAGTTALVTGGSRGIGAAVVRSLHGAGANVSDNWRFGVFLSYSLGWLRQEENQYVDTPYDLARTMPKQLRDLLGYKMHSALGFMDPRPHT